MSMKETRDLEDADNTKPKKIKVQDDVGVVSSIGTGDNGSGTIGVVTSNSLSNNGAPSRVIHIRNIPYEAAEADLINLARPFGKILNQMMTRGNNQAFIEFADVSSAQCMVNCWHPSAINAQPTLCGRRVYVQFSKHQQIKKEQSQTMNPLQAAVPTMPGFGTVLLVSNLSEPIASPDALFNLFGVYSDVMRVKILHNDKDKALVQLADPNHVSWALTYLDGLRLYGKPMRVTLSKFERVVLPKEGQVNDGLTKNYSGSPFHRFKGFSSKNKSNIYPPSPTLHLSNIPASIDEEQILEAFLTNMPPGTVIVNFKFFPNSGDKRMALIQFQNVEKAVIALVTMHNYQLQASSLRVSFTKSKIM